MDDADRLVLASMLNAFSFDVDAGDFQAKVIDASRRTPVLVDFWAEWCGPCRVLKPVLEKLASEYGGRFLLARVDTDRNQELAAHFAVRGIPSVKAFVDGEMLREFTGALPEAQIRAFIDGLLPSPAEPLRAAAREARAKGDLEVARALLDDALELDPGDEAAQLDLAEIEIETNQLEAARRILDALQHASEDGTRVRALQARLNLLSAGAGADPAALRARIGADACDLDARLQLANALALQHDYAPALEQLLEIVRQDRKWQDEAARRAMLDLFALLGDDPRHDDLVREYRLRLARTLN